MSELRNKLGLKIKELRIKRNLKQAQLAELVGIETTSICKIENGHHFPSEDNLEKIAKSLTVEIKDLFEFTPQLNKAELVTNIQLMLNNTDEKTVKLAYKLIHSIVN